MRLLHVSVATLAACSVLCGAEWVTDGGNSQRTGWQKNEHILNKQNVKNLKILWKIETGNQPRALHSMMPAVIANNVKTDSGPKQIAIVAGISDNLYAIDVKAGKIIWQKHFTYKPVKDPHAFFDESNVDPRHLGFLNPGGSSDVPTIGPPDAEGRRPVYFVDGGGTMHTLSAADGEDLKPPFPFATGKGWALNLVGDTIWMPHGGEKISAVRLSDPSHVMTATDGSGGMWGLRGVSVDSTGTAWTTTGDGMYDPANGKLANGIVGFHIVDNQLKVKDWYEPIDWKWIRKRDLDPNNTPAIFTYKGKELMVASGKECRMFLMDPRSPGGADHRTPLYRSPLFCNDEVDFQNAGSWGGITTWVDGNGTRWILAPFWGPPSVQTKFPIVNTPVSKGGGIAAFKLEEKNGKWTLKPAWVSQDMDRAYPPVVANGVVYAFGSGESTQQAWPVIGLDFDSSVRAAKSTHATLYALDAETGKTLYSSGDQIKDFTHFTELAIANGRLYLGTYDGTEYCFGLAGH